MAPLRLNGETRIHLRTAIKSLVREGALSKDARMDCLNCFGLGSRVHSCANAQCQVAKLQSGADWVCEEVGKKESCNECKGEGKITVKRLLELVESNAQASR